MQLWSWVDRALAQSIAAGEFEIKDLPKLHFNDDIKLKHASSFLQYFSNYSTFNEAWMVYRSIRGFFDSEYTLPLQIWLANLSQMSRSAQWIFVLNYVIAFFNANKHMKPEAWLTMNADLVTRHIILPSQALSSFTGHPRSSPLSVKKFYANRT